MTVDFERKEATVDAAPCDTAKMLVALSGEGYKATVKEMIQ